MAKLSTIEGIGPSIEKKLKKAGIGSVEALLKTCCDKKGRKEVAAATKMDEKKLLTFVNHADLMRLKGVGGQYAELLEAAGVDSTAELKQRNAANLRAKMEEVNSKGRKRLVRQLPAESQIKRWVTHAKRLKKLVTH